MSDSFDLGGFSGGFGGADDWTMLDNSSFGGGNVSGDDYFENANAGDTGQWTLEEPSFWQRVGSNLTNKDNLKALQSGASAFGKLTGSGSDAKERPAMPGAAGLFNKGQASPDTMNLIQQLRERSRQIASLRSQLSGGGGLSAQLAPIMGSGLLGRG